MCPGLPADCGDPPRSYNHITVEMLRRKSKHSLLKRDYVDTDYLNTYSPVNRLCRPSILWHGKRIGEPQKAAIQTMIDVHAAQRKTREER